MRQFIILAVLAACIAGCESRAEKAATYNDVIIAHQVEVMQAMEGLDSLLYTRDSTTIEEAFVVLKGEIIKGEKKVRQLGAFKNDQTFHAASEALFKSYRALTEEQYPSIIALLKVDAPADTVAHVNQIMGIESDIHRLRTAAFETFETAQAAFGEKFNLVFEVSEE